ncbi:hypothetical protein KATP_26880 [Kluyvera ascorbata]|nr:hypothetical protein KATP_26880 [Kluyvera ascorbata]
MRLPGSIQYSPRSTTAATTTGSAGTVSGYAVRFLVSPTVTGGYRAAAQATGFAALSVAACLSAPSGASRPTVATDTGH